MAFQFPPPPPPGQFPPPPPGMQGMPMPPGMMPGMMPGMPGFPSLAMPMPKQRGPKPPKVPHPKDPSHTLYVHNLNEKINLRKTKTTLENIFKEHGAIHDIILKKTNKLRGQAWVIFKSVESAEKAKKALNGFEMFGKPLDVHFAKVKSDAIVKDLGEDLETHKVQRREAKAKRDAVVKATAQPTPAAPKKPVVENEYMPPNNILFIQHIPEGVPGESLIQLFSQYPGYKEVRTIPAKHDIAFVEFENEGAATAVKQAFIGYEIIPGKKLKVNFAKK